MSEPTNPVASIFDHGDDWHFPSEELCRREKLWPNLLAFNKTNATLALVVKRSFRGTDFALSEAGLLYLESTLAKGTLQDDSPIRAAFVVMAEGDLRNPHHLMKMVTCWSALKTRQYVDALGPSYPGKFGAFWWITAGTLVDEDAPFRSQKDDGPL
jgi:hypothetical protein